MTTEVESIRRVLVSSTRETGTMSELASQLSDLVQRVVPHDGYALFGLDPITETVAFTATRDTYRAQVGDRLEINHVAGVDPNPFASLISGTHRVGVFGLDSPRNGRTARLHDIMAADGIGSDLSVALTLAGRAWGGLALVRERGRTPFSASDALRAEWLRTALAMTVQQFVRRLRFGPACPELPPGVLVVDRDNTIDAATATVRTWLERFVPYQADLGDEQLPGHLLSVAAVARRSGTSAVSRIPTAEGWIGLHAQPLAGGASGRLAITIQPATAAMLVPALPAWYGITNREQAVIGHLLQGIPAKQIAHQLNLSHHTVNDHLKAIYRKTGLGGRDELLASLCT